MAKPVTSEKKFAVGPIRTWMRRNVRRFVDSKTGEVDCTKMVETWDLEVWDGELSFGEEGSRHVAWDVAIDVGDAYRPDPMGYAAVRVSNPEVFAGVKS